MKTLLVSIVTTLGLLVTCATYAQAPASAPAGTTGQCKDGTWYSGASKKGACHGHEGVKEWYGAADASTSSTSTKSTAKSTSSTSASTPTSSKDTHAASTASTTSSAATGTPPAGATGLCNDGTYYSGENKRGACHGHKGVKTWYGAASTTSAVPAATAATPAPAAMPAATPPTAAPAKPAMAPAATPATTHTTAATGTPAPGGGAGKVWVNTSSKVYHCQGDRYYGATKEGEYMSEADAIAKGNHASHGKACSQ